MQQIMLCRACIQQLCSGCHCLLQGAVITGNDVAGLVLNGSADVAITDSSFVGNKRKHHAGGALIAAGRSRLRVERTQFINNSAETDKGYAGLWPAEVPSALLWLRCGWPTIRPAAQAVSFDSKRLLGLKHHGNGTPPPLIVQWWHVRMLP